MRRIAGKIHRKMIGMYKLKATRSHSRNPSGCSSSGHLTGGCVARYRSPKFRKAKLHISPKRYTPLL